MPTITLGRISPRTSVTTKNPGTVPQLVEECHLYRGVVAVAERVAADPVAVALLDVGGRFCVSLPPRSLRNDVLVQGAAAEQRAALTPTTEASQRAAGLVRVTDTGAWPEFRARSRDQLDQRDMADLQHVGQLSAPSN